MEKEYQKNKKIDTDQSRENDLGTKPVGKLLFSLALPAITAQIVNVLYNMVDRIYIGHIPVIGAQALTGVGVTMPIIMLISAFAALVSMGGAPRASIMMGKGQKATAQQILGNCMTALIIAAAILTAVVLLFGRDLLLMFGASENTIEYAWAYMAVYAWGTVFVQISLGMNAFITAQGFSKISMLTVVIGAVCNIILDPIFIFGLNLGVRGAALATIISQAVSAVWVIRFLTGKKTYLRICPENLWIKPKVFFPCMALGLSPFIMQSTESILFVCFNSSLLKYGGDMAVGAMTILTSIMQFAMLPLQGLTQGAQPITSFNYGAQNKERVKKCFYLLLRSSLIYSGALWILVLLFPNVFAGIFATDAELVATTVHAMRIYMAASLILGVQIACQQTFISMGNAKTSVFLALLRKVILLIPLIYILPQLLSNKVDAVFMAEPVADIIAVSVTATLFFRSFRKYLYTL
ncbi:MAG: MATE family efflux transporter [Lachnospiraceae bacterium]|nr:MATE family efflux transporter [Lachnospiraceae bacterium]